MEKCNESVLSALNRKPCLVAYEKFFNRKHDDGATLDRLEATNMAPWARSTVSQLVCLLKDLRGEMSNPLQLFVYGGNGAVLLLPLLALLPEIITVCSFRVVGENENFLKDVLNNLCHQKHFHNVKFTSLSGWSKEHIEISLCAALTLLR